MASRLDAERAAGFSGSIVYDLGLADGTRRAWNIDVRDGKARARLGKPASPALTVSIGVPDFIRLITQAQPVYQLIADGKVALDGDLGLAARLGDMFGGDSVY